jgi:hypothetical protein
MLLLLWTIRHRWAAGSRFAFDCYRHAAQLILRGKGCPGYTLLSSEGVTQGDPLSMVLYGLALVPLTKKLWQEHPEAVQAWYADNGLLKGRTSQVAGVMTPLQRLGPERGYFPEPAKSIYMYSPEDWLGAEELLQAFSFKFTGGYRYVGGFLDSDAALSQWLPPQIQQWVSGVASLAKVAKRYPQTAYAGLTKSLQQEWQYLQRAVPNCRPAFEPVEEAIRMAFLPALLEATEAECQRDLTTISVCQAGLGLPNPVQSFPGCFAASKACTSLLVTYANIHTRHASQERRGAQLNRAAAQERRSRGISHSSDPATQKRMLRTKETGAWLTAMPDRLNGNELSADKSRDSHCHLDLSCSASLNAATAVASASRWDMPCPARREAWCCSTTTMWRPSGTISAPKC